MGAGIAELTTAAGVGSDEYRLWDRGGLVLLTSSIERLNTLHAVTVAQFVRAKFSGFHYCAHAPLRVHYTLRLAS